MLLPGSVEEKEKDLDVSVPRLGLSGPACRQCQQTSAQLDQFVAKQEALLLDLQALRMRLDACPASAKVQLKRSLVEDRPFTCPSRSAQQKSPRQESLLCPDDSTKSYGTPRIPNSRERTSLTTDDSLCVAENWPGCGSSFSASIPRETLLSPGYSRHFGTSCKTCTESPRNGSNALAKVVGSFCPDLVPRPKDTDDTESDGGEFTRAISRKRRSTNIKITSKATLAMESMTCDATWSERLVASPYFNLLCTAVLLSNILFIGWQVNDQAHNPTQVSVLFQVVDTVYALIFGFELIVRLHAAGAGDFFCGEDKYFNWTDCIIVGLSVFDVVFESAGIESMDLRSMTIARAARMLRLLRVCRLIRTFRFCRALRVIVLGIASTLKDGLGAIVLLVLLMYSFSLVFVQVVTDTQPDVASESDVFTYFGTVPRSMYTLYMAIHGGIDWEIASLGLSDVSPVLVCIFVCYVAFCYLAVLNVVTGLFCQNAMKNALGDEMDMLDEHTRNLDKYVESLARLFNEWDADGSGTLNIEVERRLDDPKMRAFMSMLGVEVDDARSLCELLVEHAQELDVEAFVQGFLRLKGQASTLHVAQIMSEIQKFREMVEQRFCSLETARAGKAAADVRSPRPAIIAVLTPRRAQVQMQQSQPARCNAWSDGRDDVTGKSP